MVATTARKRLSTVRRGTAFEQRALHILQAHFSMSLRRVGGRSDGGIDLVGWWWLPLATVPVPAHRHGTLPDADGLLRRRLRILAQCKAEKRKLGPKYVREMEGVWYLQSRSHPHPHPQTLSPPLSPSLLSPPSPSSSPAYESTAPDTYPTVAILLSESPFSLSTVLHAYRSTVPLLLMHLPPPPLTEPSATPSSVAGDEDEDTRIGVGVGTVCPNPALTRLVHPLAFCWERHPAGGGPPAETDASTGGGGSGGRPGLWWQGRKLDSWAPDLAWSDGS